MVGQTVRRRRLGRGLQPLQADLLGGAVEDVELEKSNILLVGPTGTGKTPSRGRWHGSSRSRSAIVDATCLTEAGYVGEDVENILVRLLQATDFNG